ncbi:hypothetical protein K503DRAFT_716704 [Rhizopogon vinicolor AM-OR11-026]|uniref:Uncharacterized protein n=1 Tax=Rhizopogon vinicolor AM-OR11-026 TaxID=1314800 RepID=A0A1B7N396_9AGAM|nr:hypothetical protein K503DRAFT_716704 [Rhizopogon vinicolor AM-OR11-026]
MSTSLEVIIQYKGSKYEKLASGTLKMPAVTLLLLKDLDALRANRPGLDNLKHVKGKFYLTWKSAGTNKDRFSLYNSWVKIAAMKEKIDDLSIESITVNKVLAKTPSGRRSPVPTSSLGENHVLKNNPDRVMESIPARTEHVDVQCHNRKEHTSSPSTQGPAKGHEQNPSVNIPQISESMEGLKQSSKRSDLRSLDSLQALIDSFRPQTKGTAANTLHQQPATALLQPDDVLDSELRTSIGLTKQHSSLPKRPVIVEASLVTQQPVPNNDAKVRFMRDLWDTRKEMAALQDREIGLIVALQRMGTPQQILESGPGRHGTTELEDRLAQVESELLQERYKRLRAERGLNAVEKECRVPFVVPALLQAFLKISEMDV